MILTNSTARRTIFFDSSLSGIGYLRPAVNVENDEQKLSERVSVKSTRFDRIFVVELKNAKFGEEFRIMADGNENRFSLSFRLTQSGQHKLEKARIWATSQGLFKHYKRTQIVSTTIAFILSKNIKIQSNIYKLIINDFQEDTKIHHRLATSSAFEL